MRWKVAGAIGLAFVGAQLVQPVTASRTSVSPVLTGAGAPEAVVAIVERSCRDCHTWNTEWPWYSRISPVSWMVAQDVENGRRFLNFSEWQNYPRARKLAYVAAMASAANQNRMPPSRYLVMHPEAALSDQERRLIKSWSRSEFQKLSSGRSKRSPRTPNDVGKGS
jgi:heme-binding protein